MNSISINLLLFTIFIGLLSCVVSNPDGFLNINCGATGNATDSNGLQWISDSPFIKSPNVNASALGSLTSPYLQYRSLTYFGNLAAKKYCYLLPVKPGLHYLVRATFGYPGSDCRIPLASFFDLIIEGIKWTKVDLSNLEDDLYVDYEVILAAKTGSLSLCLGRKYEIEEKHFVYISSISLRPLNSSMYNSTDFEKQALNLIGRTDFGQYRQYGKPGGYLVYPEDQFDRLWKPYSSSSMTTGSSYLEVVADEYGTENLGFELWNKPPVNVLRTALAKQGMGDMTIFGAFNLSCSSGSYYFALYFCNSIQTNLTQIFNVSINNYQVSDYKQYAFQRCWQVNKALELPTCDTVNVTLSGGSTSKTGPFINAAEMYKILDATGTYSGDVLAMRKIAEAMSVPEDWAVGDPCFPAGYSFTGITCSTDNPARAIIINLRNKGLKGTLPPEIANLTALTQLLLGNNNLSGPVPDLSSLKNLTKLQLQNNQLTGEIPRSLENLPNLTHLFLQNNKLNGRVSQRLWGRRMELQNKVNDDQKANAKSPPQNASSPSVPNSTQQLSKNSHKMKTWVKMLLIGLSALVGGIAFSATLLSKLRRLWQRCCTSQGPGKGGRSKSAGEKQAELRKYVPQVEKLAQEGRRASICTRVSKLVGSSCSEDPPTVEDGEAQSTRPVTRFAEENTGEETENIRSRNRDTGEEMTSMPSRNKNMGEKTENFPLPNRDTGEETQNIRPGVMDAKVRNTRSMKRNTKDETESISPPNRNTDAETENSGAQTPASNGEYQRPAERETRQVPSSEVTISPPINDVAFQAVFLSRYIELQNKLLDATLQIGKLQEREAIMQIGRLQEREAIMSQSSRATVPTTYVSRDMQTDHPQNPKK